MSEVLNFYFQLAGKESFQEPFAGKGLFPIARAVLPFDPLLTEMLTIKRIAFSLQLAILSGLNVRPPVEYTNEYRTAYATEAEAKEAAEDKGGKPAVAETRTVSLEDGLITTHIEYESSFLGKNVFTKEKIKITYSLLPTEAEFVLKVLKNGELAYIFADTFTVRPFSTTETGLLFGFAFPHSYGDLVNSLEVRNGDRLELQLLGAVNAAIGSGGSTGVYELRNDGRKLEEAGMKNEPLGPFTFWYDSQPIYGPSASTV